MTAVATLISKQRETYKPITCSNLALLHNITVFCGDVSVLGWKDTCSVYTVWIYRTAFSIVESDVSVSGWTDT